MNAHSQAVAKSFHYQLFGLHIRSEIELPELPPAPGAAGPDVTIGLGKTPPTPVGGGAGPHAVGGGLLLPIDEVGRFFIKDGAEIVIEPDRDVPDGNVRLFLLGSAMGALLHQRGLLPLHANAIEIEGKAVAFMGASGAGKSTLAAWFHDRGYSVVADDVCVVRFADDGRPLASPGVPRLRLWREAIEASGRDPSDYSRSFIFASKREKYDVPASRAAAAPKPLAAIYALGAGEEFAIAPLAGIEAAEALHANTYRGGFIPRVGDHRAHWQACLRLLSTTPMFRVLRKLDFAQADSVNEALLEHARQLVG